MKICILTIDYPYKRSHDFVFVQQIAEEFAKQGNECTVVAPYWINVKKQVCFDFVETRSFPSGGKLMVYRPNFFTVSTIEFRGHSISLWLREKAANFALRHLPWKPDVIYGHFWIAGYMGYSFAHRHNIPLIVASGESDINAAFPKKSIYQDYSDYVSGVVCVSTKNKDDSIEYGWTVPEKCIVLPNAIDTSLFMAKDKNEIRRRLNIPLDVFVISFVGWFIERKGPLRVSQAISSIPDNNVYSLFIGAGEQEPDCKNILFKGSLAHSEVSDYLCASDAFVLPTQKEGCCNAVIEAMACGLPVISSNLPFNWDVLNETNSILVDPNNIEEIKNAICTLRDDAELRLKLAEGSLRKARDLSIEQRAKSILSFIEKRILK